MTDLSGVTASQPAQTRSAAFTLPVFAATLFLSAFLLFSVQPFFAKMVLPKLGGSPGVWSVAMVFFQAALLAGYGYAHFLTSRFSPRISALIHLGVMAAALMFLPTVLPAGWDAPPESGQALWLLGLFTVAIGLPFFAVSANGPLLQAWFARTGHPHAADPYFLYGASNIGSFASLILFIVLIEPFMTVGAQAQAWTGGFVLLGLSIAACAWLAGRDKGTGIASSANAGIAVEAPTWMQKLQWVALAFIPSGLLVAVTAHLSTDIAAAPFLWVVPLALFLLTFVAAFARKPWIGLPALSGIVPLLAAIVFVTFAMGNTIPVAIALLAHLALFFFAALLCHSVLVSKRPAAQHLTGFYLWMSAGGVLGGAFASLLAPLIFNWVAEYTLLIAAAMFARPQMWEGDRREMRIFIPLGALITVVMNNPLVVAHAMPADIGFYSVAIAAFAIVAALIRYRSEAMTALFFLLAVGLHFALQEAQQDVFKERSFFGVVRAFTDPDNKFAIMAHGTTEHGAQWLRDTGKPTPIAYYHESGGIASALFAMQEKRQGMPSRVGIVGLGVGSMLCHRRDGETWTLFEIDASVVRVARRDDIFRFMSDCGDASDEIVLGDARLTLGSQPSAKFDYLLIDAFSSDSIPLHLLTVEALELYRSRLAPGGILAIHISNRFMELESVVAALARETGMVGRSGYFKAPAELVTERVNPSLVAVLANTEADLGTIAADKRWKPLDSRGTRAWTDDFSNILSAILRMAFN